MCIIVVKPKGVEMPDSETLLTCDWSNPDGSGFMFAHDGRVKIRKGFMSFDDFENAINCETAHLDVKNTAIIMHFRIATHGKVIPSCCHPFPLTDNFDMMRRTKVDCHIGIAHNGVIDGRYTNDTVSDTMDFIASVINPLSKIDKDFIHNDNARELLLGACDSKLAIMDGNGDIMLVGHFHDENGVLYSNSGYKSTPWRKYYDSLPWGSDDYYSPYGYDDAECDISDLIKYLPFKPCKDCQANEECALTCPECENEEEAEEVKKIYDELYADEITIEKAA